MGVVSHTGGALQASRNKYNHEITSGRDEPNRWDDRLLLTKGSVGEIFLETRVLQVGCVIKGLELAPSFFIGVSNS